MTKPISIELLKAQRNLARADRNRFKKALSDLTSWAENLGYFTADDPVFHATLRSAQKLLNRK
jgi:hypothetical protein